jgi:hypothetical protein
MKNAPSSDQVPFSLIENAFKEGIEAMKNNKGFMGSSEKIG